MLINRIIYIMFFLMPLSLIIGQNSFPDQKIKKMNNDFIEVPVNTSVLIDSSFEIKFKASVDSLKKIISTCGSSEDNKSVFNFEFQIINKKDFLIQASREILDDKEAYVLNIEKNKVFITATTDQGLLNGLSTLENFLINSNEGKIPFGKIVDFPSINNRILHISLWPCEITDFKDTIRLARLQHFNSVIILNHHTINLKSLSHLVENGWSIDEFKKVLEFINQNGLEVIPELRLLTHQEKFLKNSRPELMYNKRTYNPNNKKIYTDVVFPAIDELLELTNAKKFHIGHDELFKCKTKKGRVENCKKLPPELFMKDISVLNEYLVEKGIETLIWGDMFLNKKDFPNLDERDLNGGEEYSKLIDQLPKNITVLDWHYLDDEDKYPTIDYFKDRGFKVFGGVWKEKSRTSKFTKYVNELNMNNDGMVATTWFGLQKKKEQVHKIIKISGKAFWEGK